MGLALGSTKKTFSLGSGDGQEKKRHSIGEFVVNVSDIPDFIDASVGDPLPNPPEGCLHAVIDALPTIVRDNARDFVGSLLDVGRSEDARLLAFVIANAIYETNGISRRENISLKEANSKYGRRGNRLGNRLGTNDAYDYRGAGFVQITGRNQYSRMQNALGALGQQIDLVGNPDLAAQPGIAIQIMLVGVKGNLFTQLGGIHGFADFIHEGTVDYSGARALINGDKDSVRAYLPEGKNTNRVTSGRYVQTLSQNIVNAMRGNPFCPK